MPWRRYRGLRPQCSVLSVQCLVGGAWGFAGRYSPSASLGLEGSVRRAHDLGHSTLNTQHSTLPPRQRRQLAIQQFGVAQVQLHQPPQVADTVQVDVFAAEANVVIFDM